MDSIWSVRLLRLAITFLNGRTVLTYFLNDHCVVHGNVNSHSTPGVEHGKLPVKEAWKTGVFIDKFYTTLFYSILLWKVMTTYPQIMCSTYLSTCATVFGPYHWPMDLPSPTPIWAETQNMKTWEVLKTSHFLQMTWNRQSSTLSHFKHLQRLQTHRHTNSPVTVHCANIVNPLEGSRTCTNLFDG